MTDDLDPVRTVRPATTGPRPEVLSRARSELMHVIDQAPPMGADRPPRRRRRRRTVVIAAFAAASVTAAGVAAAGSLFFERARTSTSVICLPDKQTLSVIGAKSGDPVADCAASWRETHGDPVPPMNAYTTENGDILVAAAELGTPPGAQPLPSGFRQNASVLQLEHELGDSARGLGRREETCKPVAVAEQQVRGELDRLGLRDWRITRPGDGDARCAVALTHGEQQVVELVARPSWGPRQDTFVPAAPTGDAEYDAILRDAHELIVRYRGELEIELSRRLAAAMIDGPEARCLSGADATAVVRRTFAEMGATDRWYAVANPVHEGWTPADAPDGSTTCVRPAVNDGPGVFLDVVPAPVPHR